MPIKMNSQEYWDQYFIKEWSKNSGQEQTIFFCQIVLCCLPIWIKEEVAKYHYSILDLGCAEGEAVNLLSQEFPNSPITGIDFSRKAINKARIKFPKYNFICQDINKLKGTYDLIFCSNVYEHFKNPTALIKKNLDQVNKYLIFLVPFQENPLHESHFESFDYSSFPLKLNGFILAYWEVINTSSFDHTLWPGKQIMIIYANSSTVNLDKITLVDYQNRELREQQTNKTNVTRQMKIYHKELLKIKNSKIWKIISFYYQAKDLLLNQLK